MPPISPATAAGALAKRRAANDNEKGPPVKYRIPLMTGAFMLAVMLPLEVAQVFFNLTGLLAIASIYPGVLEICIFIYWFYQADAFKRGHFLQKLILVFMLCTEILPFWNAVFWGTGAVIRMIYIVRIEDMKVVRPRIVPKQRSRLGAQRLSAQQSEAANDNESGLDSEAA